MCGICGLALTKDSVKRPVLEAMNAALFHRGPDEDGFFIQNNIGLAMRRLSIIDLSTGRQPIANENGTVQVVFNGEIYNYQALQARLREQGHRFATRSDTEVIVHLYEEYGADFVTRLRGQFAIALWDAKKKRLLLARDRFGQKPLYYALRQGSLYFASELKSLLKGLPSKPEIHIPSLDLYLALQYIPDPLTAYRDVFKLPPAHLLLWQEGQTKIQPYWDLPFAPKWEQGEDELQNRLRELLSESVRLRMISDVPLGAHLSGGLDSSIVVALMAQHSSRPVKTFSIGFNESRFSELQYARAVAERFGTEHTEFIVEFGNIPETIEKLVSSFDEPFADSSALPLFYLSELTRQHVTVALNGDGGDDLLAGYTRHWLDPWGNRYLSLPGWLRRGAIGAASLFQDDVSRPAGHSWLNGLKRLAFLEEIPPEASILRWSSYFFPSQRRRLWKPEFWQALSLNAPSDLLLSQIRGKAIPDALDRTLYMDVKTYLPGDLLVKTDRVTMAHSLEARSPLLDHVFAEWAVRLPVRYKLRGRQGKYLLRQAFKKDLPDSILKHKKQGFGIPLGLWFKRDLQTWAQDELSHPLLGQWFEMDTIQGILNEHRAGAIDHGRRIWTLIILKKWLERQT